MSPAGGRAILARGCRWSVRGPLLKFAEWRSSMKTVVIVAPHFLPSFLASVHRARLLAYHLPEFGWKPIILTTDPKYYECQLDWELLDLLPEDLEIVKVKAFPTK